MSKLFSVQLQNTKDNCYINFFLSIDLQLYERKVPNMIFWNSSHINRIVISNAAICVIRLQSVY